MIRKKNIVAALIGLFLAIAGVAGARAEGDNTPSRETKEVLDALMGAFIEHVGSHDLRCINFLMAVDSLATEIGRGRLSPSNLRWFMVSGCPEFPGAEDLKMQVKEKLQSRLDVRTREVMGALMGAFFEHAESKDPACDDFLMFVDVLARGIWRGSLSPSTLRSFMVSGCPEFPGVEDLQLQVQKYLHARPELLWTGMIEQSDYSATTKEDLGTALALVE